MTIKLKRVCQACLHKHREGIFCHVFVESADYDEFDENDDDDNSGGGDGEDDDSISLGITESKKKSEKIRPLPTPKYVQKIGFSRCNCQTGIPENSKRFEPCPHRQKVGFIKIQTYDEIMSKKKAATEFYDSDEEKARNEAKQKDEMVRLGVILPLVLRFTPFGQVCFSSYVSRAWKHGVDMYQDYVDIRDAVPWQVVIIS
jgi:hypothetical protein